MMEENIYAAPETAPQDIPDNVSVTHQHVYLKDGSLWVSKDFVSPNLCMVSGVLVDPAASRKKITLYYVPSLAYLSLLLIILPGGILLVFICLAILQKKLKLQISLSESVIKRRKRRLEATLISLTLSIFAAIGFVMMQQNLLLIICFICIGLGLVFGILARHKVRAVGYREKYFKLKGVHDDFLRLYESKIG